MEMKEYQVQAAKTAQYPEPTTIKGLLYVTLGLAGEAGEIANKVKKVLRDDNSQVTETREKELIDELGDCLWYLSMMVSELGYDLDYVAELNLEKLAKRKIENKIVGSGDKR